MVRGEGSRAWHGNHYLAMIVLCVGIMANVVRIGKVALVCVVMMVVHAHVCMVCVCVEVHVAHVCGACETWS